MHDFKYSILWGKSRKRIWSKWSVKNILITNYLKSLTMQYLFFFKDIGYIKYGIIQPLILVKKIKVRDARSFCNTRMLLKITILLPSRLARKLSWFPAHINICLIIVFTRYHCYQRWEIYCFWGRLIMFHIWMLTLL